MIRSLSLARRRSDKSGAVPKLSFRWPLLIPDQLYDLIVARHLTYLYMNISRYNRYYDSIMTYIQRHITGRISFHLTPLLVPIESGLVISLSTQYMHYALGDTELSSVFEQLVALYCLRCGKRVHISHGNRNNNLFSKISRAIRFYTAICELLPHHNVTFAT